MLHAQIMHMFCVLDPKCLNVEILMRTPIILVQRALDYYPIMYQTKISIFLCFGPQVPIYGNLPPDPSILGIFKTLSKCWNHLIHTRPTST